MVSLPGLSFTTCEMGIVIRAELAPLGASKSCEVDGESGGCWCGAPPAGRLEPSARLPYLGHKASFKTDSFPNVDITPRVENMQQLLSNAQVTAAGVRRPQAEASGEPVLGRWESVVPAPRPVSGAPGPAVLQGTCPGLALPS